MHARDDRARNIRVQPLGAAETRHRQGWISAAVPMLAAAPGHAALASLAVAGWVAIALARSGHFAWWPAALTIAAAALVFGGYALWRASRRDQVIVLLLSLAAIVLFCPPSEHVPLFGDGAIYPNTGALIARTGGTTTTFDLIEPLTPASRQLFYLPASEQTVAAAFIPFHGLVDWTYYLTDANQLVMQDSRPPFVEAWFALMIKLGGVHFSLYSTPVFALLSLIMLYALGTAAWNWQAGLWAVVLLAVSYPQIHYGRTPFAEMFGQFWSLTTLYFGVAWLKQARPHLLVASLLAWAMAWATRGEALLLLAPIGLLLFAAALRRDVRSLAATAIALVPVAGLTALGTNRVYFDAQLGIYAVQWPWLKLVLPALILGMAVFLALAWVYRRQLLEWLPRVQRPASLLAIAASGFVVLWSTIPNPLRVPGVTRSYQEVVWFSSDYVTPLFYWLALAGTLWLIYRYRSAPTFLLALTTLVVAGVLFFRHTTSPYYPFALRRLTSEVFPLMALMAGVALTADWLPRPWPTVRPILGALLAVWMLVLSLPVIGQRESAGSVAFLQDLHQQTPAGAALIFEQQDDDSWVGWLAPPLYSVYGDNALLLHSDTPDPAALSGAVTALQSAGHPVYVVSQHDPLPAGLLPPGYQATLERTLHWRSSFIGHTRAPYPPPFWEFEFPVNFYRLQATATANNR